MTDDNLQAETPAEGAPVLSDDIADNAAPPTAPDETPEQEASTDDAGKPETKGVGKRIDELTRYRREAERERDYWREMAMRGNPQPAKAEDPPPPAAPKIPSLADFEYDESKYQAALIEFTKAEARREAEAVLKAEREREAQERVVKTWTEKAAEFAKSKPDYAEKVNDPTLPISTPMVKVIQASEIGPEVAYHLAENRELAAEIARLPAEAAAFAIGRLEGRLLAQKEAAKASASRAAVSQAPPPPPRIEAVEPDVRVRTTDPSGDSLSDDEWVRMERKRVSRKGSK